MMLSISFAVGLLTFLVVLVLTSFRYSFEVRLFPMVVGIPAIVLMLVQIVTELSERKHRKGQVASIPQKDTGSRATWRAHASIVGWIVGFLLTIYLVGFLPAIVLFVFLYLKLHGGGWLRSLGVAAGIEILIYCIFTLGMKMHLYPGVFSFLKL